MIKRQGSGVRETFTVRKQSFGVGVERTFPLHSPKIEKLEVAARGDVRRAKLYYLRDRVGKGARVAERRWGIEDDLVDRRRQRSGGGRRRGRDQEDRGRRRPRTPDEERRGGGRGREAAARLTRRTRRQPSRGRRVAEPGAGRARGAGAEDDSAPRRGTDEATTEGSEA